MFHYEFASATQVLLCKSNQQKLGELEKRTTYLGACVHFHCGPQCQHSKRVDVLPIEGAESQFMTTLRTQPRGATQANHLLTPNLSTCEPSFMPPPHPLYKSQNLHLEDPTNMQTPITNLSSRRCPQQAQIPWLQPACHREVVNKSHHQANFGFLLMLQDENTTNDNHVLNLHMKFVWLTHHSFTASQCSTSHGCRCLLICNQ